jgi:hypothetical protein
LLSGYSIAKFLPCKVIGVASMKNKFFLSQCWHISFCFLSPHTPTKWCRRTQASPHC